MGANFPDNLESNNTQILMLRKVFVNNSSAHIKLSKNQLYEIGLKTGLPLMKNEFKPLAKSVSIALGLTAAVPATDTAIQKKILGSGLNTSQMKKWMISWKLLNLSKSLVYW